MAAAADGAHVQLVSRVAGGPSGITEGAPGIFYFTTAEFVPGYRFLHHDAGIQDRARSRHRILLRIVDRRG
jgi:hypothetical protein